MALFEQFEKDLREALNRLYDPCSSPSQLLVDVLGVSPYREGHLQELLRQAVDAMQPDADVPPAAHIQRLYKVLHLRYIAQRTQEEAAELLGITSRHLRREQSGAIHALALRLWQQWWPSDAPTAGETSRLQAGQDVDSVAWRSQVKEELAALEKSAPGASSDLKKVLGSVVDLVRMVSSSRGVIVSVDKAIPHALVPIHPSALRQILLKTATGLISAMEGGSVQLSAQYAQHEVQVVLNATPPYAAGLPRQGLVQELLGAHGGTLQVLRSAESDSLILSLPLASSVSVLVIDDNTDLVHFFGRYTSGTRYQIVHAPTGREVFERVETANPDIIVLDVMLPDMDGWELLALLHEHPDTKTIPVVVCSVVREKELALTLGAACCLMKPVRRQEFLTALDYAHRLAISATPTAP